MPGLRSHPLNLTQMSAVGSSDAVKYFSALPSPHSGYTPRKNTVTSAPLCSCFPPFFLWLGAAFPVTETHTGRAIADAGAVPGFTAIIVGHAPGSFLLGLMWLIGYRPEKPSIMRSRLSFGEKAPGFSRLPMFCNWQTEQRPCCNRADFCGNLTLFLLQLWCVTYKNVRSNCSKGVRVWLPIQKTA